MKPVYYKYWRWEDFANGMFHNKKCSAEPIKAVEILRDEKRLYEAMTYVAFNWKYSAEMNLSNRSRNRQAWLGQASCCYSGNVSEENTKKAWSMLTEQQRVIANGIADRVILEWEDWYIKNIHGQLWFF